MKPLPRIRFGSEPQAGLAIVIDDQRYEVVEVFDHVRLDGEPTRLTVWRSRCAECGASFEFKTSVAALPANRRCDEHKSPGTKVRRCSEASQ